MLWFYTGAVDAVGYREKSLARLLEALHVNWDTWNTKAAVLQFLKHKVCEAKGRRFWHAGLCTVALNSTLKRIDLPPHLNQPMSCRNSANIGFIVN